MYNGAMNKLWSIVGLVAFWLLWPALYIYLFRSERSRVIITSQNKILLVKGWLGNGHWILPGGGIHKGESAEAGAIREVLEETGVTLLPADLKKIGQGKANEYGLKFAYVAFLANLPKAQNPARQKWELTDAGWMPLPETLERPDISPETKRILASWNG